MTDLKEDLLKRIYEELSDFDDDEKVDFLEDLIGTLESRVAALLEKEAEAVDEAEAEDNDT